MRKLGIRQFRLNCTSTVGSDPLVITNNGNPAFYVIPAGENFKSSVLEASCVNEFYSTTLGIAGASGASIRSEKKEGVHEKGK